MPKKATLSRVASQAALDACPASARPDAQPMRSYQAGALAHVYIHGSRAGWRARAGVWAVRNTNSDGEARWCGAKAAADHHAA